MSGTITLHPSRQGACQGNVPEPNTHHLSLSCCTQSSASTTISSPISSRVTLTYFTSFNSTCWEIRNDSDILWSLQKLTEGFQIRRQLWSCLWVLHTHGKCIWRQTSFFFFYFFFKLNFITKTHSKKWEKKSLEFQQLMQNQRCGEQSHHYMSEVKLILKRWKFTLKAKNT